MARRRMIDPNIWGSEDMAKLTIQQRLLVIGMFSNADDEGKGKAKAAYVRSIVFPYDDIHTHEIIDDLETIKNVISIEFYEVEGNSYYKFSNWSKWQRVDKPQPSIIPDPIKIDSKNESKNEDGLTPESLLPKGKEEKGKEININEEKGREDGLPQSSDSDPIKDSILKLINECKIEEYTLFDLDEIYSFIGVVDIEIIEAAIKKGQDKHINYTKKTLTGFMKEGKTKKEHLHPKPKVGENNGDNQKMGEGVRQGSASHHDQPYAGPVGWLPSKYNTGDKIIPLREVQ